MHLSFVLHVLGCQAILLEGKVDKRHSEQSHLRHQGFSSGFQKSETSLKEIQLGSAAHQICLNTFIQGKCVKCSAAWSFWSS